MLRSNLVLPQVKAKEIKNIKGNLTFFFVKKSLSVIAGIIILIFAHIIASLLRNLLIRKGKDAITTITKQEQTGDYTSQEIVQQANKTNLIYITIGNIIYYTIMIIVFVSILKFLGLEATSIIALLGTVGFALGLALQGTLSDISSGILLAMMQLYAIGDMIELNGMRGEVKDFTLLNTVIQDVNSNAIVTIPNRKVQEGMLINYTRNKLRLAIIDILLSNKNKDYDSIIEDIRQVVLADPKVARKDMEPVIGVESMSTAGTVVRIKFLVNTDEFTNMTLEMKTKIRQMLAEKKVEMLERY